MMVCSSPADCAEIERRHATGNGLLVDGGVEPRQPALRRGRRDDPHRQPHRRREAARTPATARSSPTASTSRARSCSSSGRSRSRSPRRRARARRDVRPRGHRGGIYPLMRGGDVRHRPRPRRLRRAHRHDARAARGLRDVRELRRGRAPLGARARRHARGAAQARPAVRAHRARAPLRAAARTRSSCSPTTGRRRARRSSSATATGSTSSSSARSRGGDVAGVAGRRRAAARWSRHAVDEATGAQAHEEAPKNDVSDRDVVVLGSGNLGLVYLMEEPRRLTLEEIDERHPRRCSPRCASTRTSAGCSCARPSTARSCSARAATRYLDDGPRRGRGPARAVLADRRAAPAAHRRLRARRRHHGRRVLRPDARRELRVRGAHLVPRRARRPADARRSSCTRRGSPLPDEPIIGAAAVHACSPGWRAELQGGRRASTAELDGPRSAIARER